MSMKQTPSPSGSPRRGVATLVVLLLIAVAMAVSYAAMRSQGTAVRIQQNASLHALARQAAATGMAVAIKRMHTADWEGVDTALTGSLDAHQGYRVTFETGDPSLALGDDDYDDWPYRVTLLSTGTAADPEEPSRTATHRIRAVLRLVPRSLSTEPGAWEEMVTHAMYQWTGGLFQVNVPARIEGAVRIQRKLELARDYLWPDEARKQYCADLNKMRRAASGSDASALGDCRPFTGTLLLPYKDEYWWLQEWGLIDFLNVKMEIPTDHRAPATPAGWSHPGELTSYRLYPGGKSYSVPAIPRDLVNVKLAPDPISNPLGVFYRNGEVSLCDDVEVHGTLITALGGDLLVQGRDVRARPVDLPPLQGKTEPVRLPTLIVGDDLRFQAGSESQLRGVLAAWDDFEIEEAPQDDISANVEGTVIAKNVLVRGRSDWFKTDSWWKDQYDDFKDQWDDDDAAPIPHFPLWLRENHGLNPVPQTVLKPASATARYHWKNWNDPLYIPDHERGDVGLRWDLLEWTDSPQKPPQDQE